MNRAVDFPVLVVALDAMAAAMEGAPIMIAMLIVFTIGGQNFERHEPMPNLATCWRRAPERMNALLAAHIADDTEKWAKVVKFAGIKAD
jgi:hypothetical protein